MQKRILVVAHDKGLRDSRSALLLTAGYAVATATDGDSTLKLLETETFDLVLLGRNSLGVGKNIEERVREAHPNLLILKILQVVDDSYQYPSRITGSLPHNVLSAIKVMLE